MDFMTAVKTVLMEKYVDFGGRAQRSEFWWFTLFIVVVNIVLQLVLGEIVALIVALALLLPGIGVAVRRLHDVDRSGWWYLLVLVPIIGPLILIFAFFIHRGTAGDNRFGADPLAGQG